MGKFEGRLALEVINEDQTQFRLLEPVEYVFTSSSDVPKPPPAVPYSSSGPNPAIVIPQGLTTDMASVPKAFWNIVSPFGNHGLAAVLHDWLYSTEMYPRTVCDDLFLTAMKDLGVSWIKRNTMWSAVRTCGWSVWNKHDPAAVAAARNLSVCYNARSCRSIWPQPPPPPPPPVTEA